MPEFESPISPEQDIKKYQSPYAQQAREKSSELGPASNNYPYTINTKISGREVELNGMRHINDPSDESIGRLKARFDGFVDSAKSPIVFIEGGMRNVAGLNEDAALLKHGEPGFMAKLAQEKNIEVRSPEPPDAKLLNELLKRFSPEDVIQYFFERRLYQWYRQKDLDRDIEELEKYIQVGVLDQIKHANGLESVSTDYGHYLFNLERRIGQRLDDLRDDEIREKLNFEVSPYGSQVSAHASDMRDRYLMAQIKEVAADGHDVFMVYGSHHIFVLEQMLKKTSSSQYQI